MRQLPLRKKNYPVLQSLTIQGTLVATQIAVFLFISWIQKLHIFRERFMSITPTQLIIWLRNSLQIISCNAICRDHPTPSPYMQTYRHSLSTIQLFLFTWQDLTCILHSANTLYYFSCTYFYLSEARVFYQCYISAFIESIIKEP